MGKPQTGSISFDIAERQAHVVGPGPRIQAIPNAEIDQESFDIVNRIRDSIGSSAVTEMPEYMRTVLKNPEIFRRQMEMGTTIFLGRLPPRERELAILRCGWLSRAPYEWGEHVELSKRIGITPEEIERVTRGSSDPGWSAHDRAILRGVEELLADQALSDESWETLAKTWDEAQMIEFPMMVGQYVATAFVQNSLRIRPAPSNPGLRNR